MAAPADVVRDADRRLFLLAAVVFPLVIVAGFARTYYFAAVLDGPPVKSLLVHVHGLLMTLWVALFVTQVFLIRTGRRRVHMALGAYGAGLAAAMLPVGFFTAASAAKYGSASTPPGIPPLVFLIVPIVDLAMFAGLVAAALALRRRPADHKRLMLLTAINFLPPALGRLPFESLQAAGPLVFFGVPAALVLAAVAYDRVRTGAFNRPLLVGGLALIASFPLRVAVAYTSVWRGVAEWILSWAA